jgi:hypothetical protein
MLVHLWIAGVQIGIGVGYLRNFADYLPSMFVGAALRDIQEPVVNRSHGTFRPVLGRNDVQARVVAAAVVGCDDGAIRRGRPTDGNRRAVVVALSPWAEAFSGGGTGDEKSQDYDT